MRVTRRAALLVAAALAVVAIGSERGLAASTNCDANASGGYANCLTALHPSNEIARALHASGLPYRLQLARFSDGTTWGWWEWSDLDYHVLPLALTGSITAQIDNRGTGNPSRYYVELL